MYIQKWKLRAKGKGAYFKSDITSATFDYEWLYVHSQDQLKKIGILGWPERENCMIQRAPLERKAFEIVCNERETTLNTTTTYPQGIINVTSSGKEETLKLIAFLSGKGKTTHLYRASQYKEGMPADILVFDEAPPSEELYQCEKQTPINFVRNKKTLRNLVSAYHWVTGR